MKCTPKAQTYKLHFHQMHRFQPKAHFLPKLDTKHVSVPQVRANGLGLGDRHEHTPTDPEYIRLLYKQSTPCKLCDVSEESQCNIGVYQQWLLFICTTCIKSPSFILPIRLSLIVGNFTSGNSTRGISALGTQGSEVVEAFNIAF